MSNSTKITNINLEEVAQDIFEKAKLNEEIINKEIGLFLPPNLEEKYLEIWEEYFTLLRIMYADKQLLKEGVNFYLKTFFEIPNDNKKYFVNDMTDAVFKKIEENETINEIMAIDEMKRQAIEKFDSLQTDEEKIEFLTYLNNGEIPAEVQALIDERDAENTENQLSPEEIDELQRNAIKNIFGKYSSNHGALNLGKGNVVSAEAIDEFINAKEDEEAKNLRAQTKIRTMPNLPNLPNSQNSNTNSTVQNQQNANQNSQNNIVNSNFTNPQTNSQINPNYSNNSNFSGQFTNPKNPNIPKNNIQNFGQINSTNSNNFQNSSQNSANIHNPNSNSNLHNPKAIPPRTRGLGDLLKK